MMDIYRENILDHYEHPRNKGHLKNPDIKAHDSNPLCGDTFDMELKFENGRVKDVRFTGHGCAISTASASMLTEKINGMKIAEVNELNTDDVREMLGVRLSHVRIKCAVLPLKIIQSGTRKVQ